MTNLTDKQKQLLQNEEVKDLILEFANWQILGMDKEILSKQLTDFTLLFAKQFEEQKDWKIISYNVCGAIMPTERVNTPDSYPINSVQYKDQVLTVGDETNKGKILKFEVYGIKLKVWIKHPNGSEQWCYISEVKKIEKEVLFVTEDVPNALEQICKEEMIALLQSIKMMSDVEMIIFKLQTELKTLTNKK